MKRNLFSKFHKTIFTAMHKVYHRREIAIAKELHRQEIARVHELYKHGTHTENIQTENILTYHRFITGQNKLAHIPYGASNIKRTGCIPVAIYNVLMRKGSPRDLAEIIRTIRMYGAALLNGRMGTDPYMIDEILSIYGVASKELNSLDSFKSAIDKAEPETLFIVTQWNNAKRPFKGIHAYMAEKTADGFLLYNKVYGEKPVQVSDTESMIGKGRFIAAQQVI